MTTKYPPRIEFDVGKNAGNLAKHGMDLSQAVAFEMNLARVSRDERRVYGEDRFIAVGPLEGRTCVLIFTVRHGVIRVISLRKANRREVRGYET